MKAVCSRLSFYYYETLLNSFTSKQREMNENYTLAGEMDFEVEGL